MEEVAIGKEEWIQIYVPGEKGGVQLKVFKYPLDFQEKTVDRKSDMADADGGIKKAWMDILMIPLQFSI